MARPPTAQNEEQLPTSDHVQFVAVEPRWFRRMVISLLLILTIYNLALWLFEATGHFLFLILLAWLIAIAMEPSIRFFERRGTSRGLGTGITLLGGFLVTLGIMAMLGGCSLDRISGARAVIARHHQRGRHVGERAVRA